MTAFHQQKRDDHGNRKWTAEHAQKFRRLLRDGWTRAELCEREGISRTALQQLLEEH